MDTVKFRVVGISALLMNNPAKMRPAEGGVGVKKIPSPEEEAESGVYRAPDGSLYVPAIQLRSSLINGAIGYKIQRRGAAQVIGGAVFLTEENCKLRHPDTKEPITRYEIDTRRAVVQTSGVLRSRPKLPEWETEIEFEYDPDFIHPGDIESVFARAGRTVGIGDYRPRGPKGKPGGPFGRYRVEMVS